MRIYNEAKETNNAKWLREIVRRAIKKSNVDCENVVISGMVENEPRDKKFKEFMAYLSIDGDKDTYTLVLKETFIIQRLCVWGYKYYLCKNGKQLCCGQTSQIG